MEIDALEKVKLKLSTLLMLSDLSDVDIGECFRCLFDYVQYGIIPDKKDNLYARKKVLIDSAKRSLVSVEVAYRRKADEQMKFANDPTITGFKSAFSELYFKLYGVNYNYTKRDNQSILELVEQVEQLAKRAGIETTRDIVLQNTILFVRKVVALNDEWITAHLCIGLLNKQFSKLYVRIKNHDQTKRNSTGNISADYISKAIAEFSSGNKNND